MGRGGGKYGKPRFIQIYHFEYDSDAFAELSTVAVRVLLEFRRKFNGYNGNDLRLTYLELKKKFGFHPKTCQKAFSELMEHGFIDKLRQGGLRMDLKEKNANVYGLSERWKVYDKNKGQVH